MPHILIVAATAQEIQPTLDKFVILPTSEGITECMINDKNHLSVLITGVGMINTAYQMGRYSENFYDCVINAGICGTFQNSIKIGSVLRVTHDEVTEMGAEDGDEFIRYPGLGLGGTNLYKENYTLKIPAFEKLKKVKGITVNKVHGNETSIEKTKLLFKPDVESMEGAAFFSGCRRFANYIQIRAVSNKVEKRDRSKWNIPLAITNLNTTLIAALEEVFYVD